MEDSSSAQSLTHLPNKFAFSLCLFKCLTIPSLLYASFSSVLSEDNVLVTHSIPVLKCVVIFNFVSWMSLTLLTWFKTNSTTGKSKIKLGVMLKCLICMLLLVLVLHFFIVLFGAALTVDVSETFHLAALAASLGLWPCVFVFGLQWEAWVTSIFVFDNTSFTGIEGCVNLGAKGALVGLYLGAIPIPLDWDRPWQTWPTTCVVGTLVGHVIGLAYYLLLTLSGMRKDSRRNKMI